MLKKIIATTVIALGLMTAPALADGVKLGTLTCNVKGTIGLLIGSVTEGKCVFLENNGTKTVYDAKFSRLGVDVGVTGNKTIVWAVFGADGRSNGGLRGNYTGVNVEASAIVGVGANALVGGLESGIVLNPLSISGQTGLSAAAGIATLRLE